MEALGRTHSWRRRRCWGAGQCTPSSAATRAARWWSSCRRRQCQDNCQQLRERAARRLPAPDTTASLTARLQWTGSRPCSAHCLQWTQCRGQGHHMAQQVQSNINNIGISGVFGFHNNNQVAINKIHRTIIITNTNTFEQTWNREAFTCYGMVKLAAHTLFSLTK